MHGKPKQPNGLLKRTQVQQLLSMGRHKVDRLRLAGQIKGFRIDETWYFTTRSVDAFINRGRDVNTIAEIAEAR